MSQTMVSSGDSGSDEWKDFDFSTVKVERPRATRSLPKRELIRLAIVGLASGAAVWLLKSALTIWAMQPLFCRTPDTASVCANSDSTAFIMSLVIVGVIAASLLASARVFRPILISAATFVSLGALWSVIGYRDAAPAIISLSIFAMLLNVFFALVVAIKRYLLAIVLVVALSAAFWLFVRI